MNDPQDFLAYPVDSLPTQKSYLTPFPTDELIAQLTNFVRKGLTCTITNDTFVAVNGNEMDATALRLVQRLKELDEQRSRISRERTAILTALEVAGVKPPGPAVGYQGSQESSYGIHHPFRGRSLPASCEIVLKDHKGQWLSKSEVEYLILHGGY